jgi:hypothetical protein
MSMHSLRERLKAWNDPIISKINLREYVGTVSAHNRRASEHAQPNATNGLFFVIALIAFKRQAVFCQTTRVARAHDPVLQHQVSDPQWLQQRIVAPWRTVHRTYL